MLAARGVSLGLGKINLSELNQQSEERVRLARLARPVVAEKPKYIIKKKADAKTVWAACRAVIFGCVVIAMGLAMAILGYFDKILAQRREVIDGEVRVHLDKLISYQLKSMQYIGPILMGIGTFVLIMACVITLESRDKHTQVIQRESLVLRKKRIQEANEELRHKDAGDTYPVSKQLTIKLIENQDEDEGYLGNNQHNHSARKEVRLLAEVHRAPIRRVGGALNPAPLADLESLLDVPLSSVSSSSPELSSMHIV